MELTHVLSLRTKSGKFDLQQAKAALLDPKAWLLALAMVRPLLLSLLPS